MRWTGNSQTCPFCDGGAESLSHWHKDCETVRSAISLIESHSVDRTRVAVLRQGTPDDFVFRNVDGVSPDDQLTLLYLSFSIWTARIKAISTSFTHKKKAVMRNKLNNQKKKISFCSIMHSPNHSGFSLMAPLMETLDLQAPGSLWAQEALFPLKPSVIQNTSVQLLTMQPNSKQFSMHVITAYRHPSRPCPILLLSTFSLIASSLSTP